MDTTRALPAFHYLNDGHGLASWLLTKDHKRIAILYLITISFFFFLGGLFAIGIRLELATPQGDLVQADTYNKFFTMHGVIMVFFFLIPSIPAVLGNFLIPLMIGAKDLAFPKLNLLSRYLAVLGGGHDMVSPAAVHLGPVRHEHDSGARHAGHRHHHRDAVRRTGLWFGIFDPARGGDPVLFQHLFWFYSHPAVYIMILPAMGVMSELTSTFSRKKIFGYSFVAFSSLAIAVFGFLVWAHHMFVAGISVYLGLGYVLPVVYFLYSLNRGAVAGPNPWRASGLEWHTSSPPPTENFAVVPIVTRDPYEYTPPHLAKQMRIV